MQFPFTRLQEQYSTKPGYKEQYDRNTPADPATYNPVSKEIVLGESRLFHPYWDNVVLDLGEYERKQKLYNEGKIEKDDLQEVGINQNYLGKMQEMEWIFQQYKKGNKRPYEDLIDKGVMSGGVLRRDEFVNLKTVKAQANIIQATPQTHVLLQIVDVRPTTDFSMKVFDWTGFDGINEYLDDLQHAVSGRGSFGSQTLDLKKYGWALAFSEEFRMETYDVPVADQHINALSGQMEVTKNQRVADIINAISKTSQGDWSAYSGNLSVRDPTVDVDAIVNTIFQTNKGRAQYIVSNRAAYNAFHKNTYVTGGTSAMTPPGLGMYDYGNKIYGNTNKFGNMGWAVDDLITNGTYAAIDPMAIIFADGPTRTVDFQDDQTGVTGTANRTWFAGKNFVPSITGGGSGVTP